MVQIAFYSQPWNSDKMRRALPIEVDPEIMSGLPVFIGTRVPVETLFTYLINGSNLGEFIECFPSVSHTDAKAILEYCKGEALSEAVA